MAGSVRKFTINPDEPFFVFDSRGEWHATLLNSCLWDARGEYVGFVRGTDHDVYTAFGEWIGRLSADGRIVRKRVNDRQLVLKIRKLPPPRPRNLPPRAPLPPTPAELSYSFVDVLEWDPDVFKNIPDLKADMS
ncbi:MAG: hypothetical protein K8J31_08345 [Anaerolineae bacterium]|jgi:hypothetical protein|nr:hypothetical protein [Anaerolineae bacterium]